MKLDNKKQNKNNIHVYVCIDEYIYIYICVYIYIYTFIVAHICFGINTHIDKALHEAIALDFLFRMHGFLSIAVAGRCAW